MNLSPNRNPNLNMQFQSLLQNSRLGQRVESRQ